MAAAVVMLDLLYRNKSKSRRKKLRAPQEDIEEISTDLQSKCRGCLGDGEIAIFKQYSEEKIVEHIEIFTGVKVIPDDDMPKFLCGSCYNLLQSAILFRRRVRSADKKLYRNRIKQESPTDDFDGGDHYFEDFKDEPSEIKTDNMKAESEDEIVYKKKKRKRRHSGEDKVYKKRSKKRERSEGVVYVERERKEPKPPKKYSCNKCDIEFPNAKEYMSHLRTSEHKKRKAEAVVKRLSCPVCNVSLAKGYLRVHMIRKHSNEKPYVCEVCGKGFPAQVPLKRHIRIHTDDLPYKCKECPYKGRFSECLKLHMRIHTGEKPYSCHMCSAQFTFQSNFKKHILSHKGDYDHKCEQCGKGFHTQAQVEKHVRIDHIGIKDFKCDNCGKEYGYKKRLTQHNRVVHKLPSSHRGRLPVYIQVENKLREEREQEERDKLRN